MKILVVGALRYSNYGDILFAKIFYKELLKIENANNIYLFETVFNPVSDFCRRELDYKKHFTLFDMPKIDCVVFVSGGYFSTDFNSFIDKKLWYYRYAYPGMFALKHKLEIIIAGIGGGGFSNSKQANMTAQIFNAASFITVRNKGSFIKFKECGVSNEAMICTADTALTIKEAGNTYRKTNTMFLHILPSKAHFEKLQNTVFPAVKKFLNKHGEYELVFGFDGITGANEQIYVNSVLDYFARTKVTYNNYSSVDGFTKLLSECKIVITPKLHVGIVASVFEASVFSFPINHTKTERFYSDIGFPERCIDLNKVNETIIEELIEKLFATPLRVDETIIEKAKLNLNFKQYLRRGDIVQ